MSKDRCVVRISTSKWSDVRGLHEKRSITFLRRQCSGFNVLDEEVAMIGCEDVLRMIINLDECKDGVYEVDTCNERHDWETGIVDGYDFKLIPFVPKIVQNKDCNAPAKGAI